ncbi:TlpA family protein disulfide reductase [Verrucomicrobia bacterium]|nr:TlpA family protein disulfide reductase [Verrucomicrobiota bacterium]
MKFGIKVWLPLCWALVVLTGCEPVDSDLVGYGQRPVDAPPPTEAHINEERSGGVKPLKLDELEEGEMDPVRMEMMANEFVQAMEPLPKPESWATSSPSAAQHRDWSKSAGEKAAGASMKARELYTLFPGHPMEGVARRSELEMMRMAVNMGAYSHIDSLEALELSRAEKEGADDGKLFEIRFVMARHRIRSASISVEEGSEIMKLAEIKRQATALMKDFPKEPRSYELLWLYAAEADGSDGVDAAEMIASSEIADQKLKDDAIALLLKKDPVGRIPEIQFKSVKGQDVSLAVLKGKIVALHFWASWSSDAVAEIPHLHQLLEESGQDMLAIVGINMDSLRSDFDKVIEKTPMAWPQHFDGNGYSTGIATKLGVTDLPFTWLLDREGRIVQKSFGTNVIALVNEMLESTAANQ